MIREQKISYKKNISNKSEIMEMGLDLDGAHNETVFGKPIFTINSGNLSHWWVEFDLRNVNTYM